MKNKQKYLLLFGLPLLLILMTNTTSAASSLFALLKRLEESNVVKLKAYLDSGGVPTIGWGSTYNWDLKRPVRITDVITKDTADKWLKYEATEKLNAVKNLLKVKINNNQLIALSSLTYNIGINAFRRSTLLKLLNNKVDKTIVAAQFDRWVYDNGQFIQGLQNRRTIEKQLFLS
jgi:lysozyme